MNPRRLSTVPAPLLRSVILATGVVGLLAAFGPAGIQNTGAAPRKDISAPSLSTEQELAGAPQPSSMLNDDLGQTDVAMAELSLAGAVRRRINRSEQAGAGCRNGLDQFAGCAANRTSACASRNGESVGFRTWRRRQGRELHRSRPSKSSTSAWSWTSASIDICGRFINGRPRRTPSRSLNGGTSPSSGRARW